MTDKSVDFVIHRYILLLSVIIHMNHTLSPLLRFMQSKVQSYQGRSDTPFIAGIQDVLQVLGKDISTELSQQLINLVSKSGSQARILKRAVAKNRN